MKVRANANRIIIFGYSFLRNESNLIIPFLN
jgi:hypothetical protein